MYTESKVRENVRMNEFFRHLLLNNFLLTIQYWINFFTYPATIIFLLEQRTYLFIVFFLLTDITYYLYLFNRAYAKREEKVKKQIVKLMDIFVTVI